MAFDICLELPEFPDPFDFLMPGPIEISDVNLMKIMISKEGKFDLDLRNEIISQTCAVHNGEYVSPMLRKILNIK